MNSYHITLQSIRDAGPCAGGWAKLLTSLGYANGKYDPAHVISIGDVAVSNGLNDALWCLRCVSDPRARVAIIMPAVKRASERTTDHRVRDCIAAIERWLTGDDTVDLRAAAADAEAAAADADADARAEAPRSLPTFCASHRR